MPKRVLAAALAIAVACSSGCSVLRPIQVENVKPGDWVEIRTAAGEKQVLVVVSNDGKTIRGESAAVEIQDIVQIEERKPDGVRTVFAVAVGLYVALAIALATGSWGPTLR